MKSFQFIQFIHVPDKKSVENSFLRKLFVFIACKPAAPFNRLLGFILIQNISREGGGKFDFFVENENLKCYEVKLISSVSFSFVQENYEVCEFEVLQFRISLLQNRAHMVCVICNIFAYDLVLYRKLI